MYHRNLGVVLFVLSVICSFAESTVGQSITGPDSAATNQPVWLTLELPAGSVGKFDSGNPDYQLDTDPTHVAVGAAMFFAQTAGEFRVVAAIVSTDQEITFAEKIIIVKGDKPPTNDEAITTANVKKWLADVPDNVRKESITHPITGETMTRQEAVGQTFLNIGKAGTAIGSIPGLDLMLSTALVSALGTQAVAWQPFADAVDTGLSKLKEQNVSAGSYSEAFLLIGRALTDE
jgi:hypothetical protein